MKTLDKPSFVLEIPFKIKENYPQILKDFWGEVCINDFSKMLQRAQEIAKELDCVKVGIYFNIEDENEIEECTKVLSEIKKYIKMPTLIRGCGQKNIDAKLIPTLIETCSDIKGDLTFGCVQEGNYANIVPSATSNTLILRTPIDINLTKELNILSIDEGLSPDNILIDPDMGCVGYGLDYGYSIIERIKCAAADGDKMLSMPIIVFAGEESYKAKETKSEDFKPSWGKIETRSISWEVATSQALICAGANIIVCWHPKTIKSIKEVFEC